MINAKKICGSTMNTRFFGAKLREAMISELNNNGEVTINLEGVRSISQSFGDESFGKFVEDIGLERFNKNVKLINLNEKNATIIKYVIVQRLNSNKEEMAVH